MASALIHIAIADKVSKYFNIKSNHDLLLGSIAPDIAKLVGIDKRITHFIDMSIKSDLPNIDLFLSKYGNFLNNQFELGYYIHLLTDYLWYKEFTLNFYNSANIITLKDGRHVKVGDKEIRDIIYNDYSNLNIQLINDYNLDLSIFYENYNYPVSHIYEFKQYYFKKLVDKLGLVSIHSTSYNYLIDIKNVEIFISYCSEYIIDNIKNLKLDINTN